MIFLPHISMVLPEKKSCLTNLLETLEDWTESLEEGFGVDVLYLDYQKAFDTVLHQRLKKKLQWYGVSGSIEYTHLMIKL
jgi:hypothetical protein